MWIEHSAKSRLGTFILIGDISYLESKAFLNTKGGKACEVLKKIFDLVGGRIKLIESITKDLEDGVSCASKSYIIKQLEKDYLLLILILEVPSVILMDAKQAYLEGRLLKGRVFHKVELDI